MRQHQFGSLVVVAAKLIHANCDGFIFVGVFALDHQYRNPVDQEDNVFSVSILPIVEGKLFGDVVGVSPIVGLALDIPVVDKL